MFSIVAAVPADAGEVLTVQRAAYLAEAEAHESFALPPLREPLDEVQAAIVAGTVLVGRLGHRLAGSVRIQVSGGTAHIGRLSVAPDLHGRGYGAALLAAAEAAAPGAVRYRLFTGPRSTGNVALYRHLGYAVIPAPDGSELIYLEKAAPDGPEGAMSDGPGGAAPDVVSGRTGSVGSRVRSTGAGPRGSVR